MDLLKTKHVTKEYKRCVSTDDSSAFRLLIFNRAGCVFIVKEHSTVVWGISPGTSCILTYLGFQ